MTWTATVRYGMEPAPGGLGFVHDFLNTAAAGKPRKADLLTEVGLATAWLAEAGEVLEGAAHCELGETDLAALRQLRDRLLAILVQAQEKADSTEHIGAGSAAVTMAVPLNADLLSDGTVRLVPRAKGWKYVAAGLLREIYRAQDADEWRRLKACRNERCPGVFYDRSRNNRGVWHDVRTCGNVANLRASRERKRAAQAGP